MDLHWQDGFEISASTDACGAIVLSANREGMVSLARILLALAEETPGSHVHLDASNSLEEGSAELIIERTAQLPDPAQSRPAKPAGPARDRVEFRLRD